MENSGRRPEFFFDRSSICCIKLFSEIFNVTGLQPFGKDKNSSKNKRLFKFYELITYLLMF